MRPKKDKNGDISNAQALIAVEDATKRLNEGKVAMLAVEGTRNLEFKESDSEQANMLPLKKGW